MAQEQLEEGATPGGEKFERQPSFASAAAAIRHMRACSAQETRRGGKDFTSELLLPISSLMLIVAIWMPGPAQIRAVAFLLPLCSFFYYLTLRIGVVATFNSRQAYLTWHMLIATFLFGGTSALFGFYVVAYLMRLAMGATY
jgi:hypothetical protein